MALAEEWTSEGDTYEPLEFQQDIALAPFLLLSLKNGLLNLVTLTLYRFWGRTEVRRRLWARISLNGEPFEYTGRGVELFLGFLIATAVIGGPFLALVFAVQFLPPEVLVPVILGLYLGMFILFGAGIYLAFRYMASRTIWRGIRFKADGSAWNFGLNFVGYTFLTSITLGWFQPAMKMRVAEGLWGTLRFGNLRLRWLEDYKQSLYGVFAIGWFGVLGVYVITLAALFGILSFNGETLAEPTFGRIAALYGVMLIAAVGAMLAFAPFHAAVLRNITGSIRLGNARFKMDVRPIELMVLSMTNIVLLFVTLGLLSPFVQARTARFLVRRLSATGTAPLGSARQASEGPKQGEGLADAFGFSPV